MNIELIEVDYFKTLFNKKKEKRYDNIFGDEMKQESIFSRESFFNNNKRANYNNKT